MFTHWSETNPERGHETTAWRVHGPAAGVIGWIPYFDSVQDVQSLAYRNHPDAQEGLILPPALTVLFRSGNTPPPPFITSEPGVDRLEAGVARFVATKGFRALAFLSQVVAEFGQDKSPLRVSCRHTALQGYTPVGRFDFQGVLAEGADPRVIEWTTSSVTIQQFIRFKIGGLGNLGALILIGEWAPWAVMIVEYTISADTSVEVNFGGSYIPSQAYYAHWATIPDTHDMLAIQENEISEFLHRGDCLNAPLRTRPAKWRGSGGQVFV